MPGTPPRWVNAVVRAGLRVPGLRRILGRGFAVITVTGARTGNRYSTPVQYQRVDGQFIVLSQRIRAWWRNISSQPEVDLLVRGVVVRCHGIIAEGDHAPTCSPGASSRTRGSPSSTKSLRTPSRHTQSTGCWIASSCCR